MKYWILFIFFFIFSLEINATMGSVKQAQQFAKNQAWAFEENKGQVTGADSASVKYFYKKGNLTMFLTEKGIAYQFENVHYPEGYKSLDKFAKPEDFEKQEELRKKIRRETYRMDIELLGANKNCEIITEGKSPDYIQYYNHNALDVHAYQKITYKNIYPNIDWVIYSTNNEQLTTNNLSSNTQNSNLIKYDFIVHAGGNPKDIQLQTKWVEDLKLNENGSLSIKNRMGEIVEHAPVSFQNGELIPTKFSIISNNSIQFNISNYNHSQDLVIDPSIAWATYYGGTNTEETGTVCNDLLGNVYISGNTVSTTNIANGGFNNTHGGGVFDVLLVKFNSNGTRIWATYYGGSAVENSGKCSTDSLNNVYLSGLTLSSTNIAYNGFENTYTGNAFIGSGFVVKFDANGQRLWGTYYNGVPWVTCEVDKNNNFLYLLGASGTINRATSGAYQTFIRGGNDALLSKFDLNGNRIWATYYGGQKNDRALDFTIDNVGNIYISGSTNSPDHISYNGFQDTFIGCTSNCVGSDSTDAFLAKFNPNGSLIWATYYGSSGSEDNAFCTTDNNGNVYLSGRTTSRDRIAMNGFQNYTASVYRRISPFIVKFNSSGTRLWGTYYGDTQYNIGFAFELEFYRSFCDNQGNLYIVGGSSLDTTVYSAGGLLNANKSYYSDGLIVKFDPNGNRVWGSLWVGNKIDYLSSVCIFNNNIYVLGATGDPYATVDTFGSSNLGYKGHQMTYSGKVDLILAKICSQIDTVKVQISANRTSVCPGGLIKFTSTDTFEGNSPHYQWRKNGTIVGSDTNIFSSNIWNNNDTIQCRLISSETCIFLDTVWSNKIIIKVRFADTTNLYDTICGNKYYVFNNQLITTAGFYRDTLISSIGCDSFIFLHLYVKPHSSYSYNFTTSCTNPSYYFNNQTLNQSGIYKDTLTNIYGCDSFITLNLKVVNPSSTSLSITRCPNQPYFFNGQNRTTSGTYTQILTNAQGCDSTITLNLNVLTNPASQSNTIWACTPFVFQGKTYVNNAVVKDTLKSSYGCDSVYLTHNLLLKPIPTTRPVIEHIVCDSVWIGGVKYTTNFSYIDTFRTTADISCDSLYQPVKYTIKYTPNLTISSKQVDTFYKGETVNLYPSQALNYLWQTGEKIRSKSFVINSDQTIYLIGWNDTECRDTAFIQLIALDPTILDFPTGFSPTGIYSDNHFFKPNINGKVEKIRFDIYNRLGEKMYFSTSQNMTGWDGTYRGKDCPAGLYSYICEYTTNRRIYFKTGEVMLVR